jgi:hypothetical protein
MLGDKFRYTVTNVRFCGHCGVGKLKLVEERRQPMLGIAGKGSRTLRCDAADCGSYLVESN